MNIKKKRTNERKKEIEEEDVKKIEGRRNVKYVVELEFIEVGEAEAADKMSPKMYVLR